MVEYVLEREGDIAAVMAEPARAVPYVPPPGFWQQVREACDRHGTLADLRRDPDRPRQDRQMFAMRALIEVVPDILVLGKSARRRHAADRRRGRRAELDVGDEFAFGHYTHEKNPVTARAALTTIEIIEDEELVANAAPGRRSAPRRGSRL